MPLAKIMTNNPGCLQTAMSASHYWFMGVEMGRPSNVTLNYGVFVVGNGETTVATLPNHIVLDRCYVHGNAAGNIAGAWQLMALMLPPSTPISRIFMTPGKIHRRLGLGTVQAQSKSAITFWRLLLRM